MFKPVINLWLRLTNLAGTSAGAEIDTWILGIAGILILSLIVIGFLSAPVYDSLDKMADNVGKPSHKRRNCSYCLHYNSSSGRCEKSNIELSDPDRQSCNLFLSKWQ